MTTVDFTDTMPLGEARDLLRELATEKGAKCPCCRQLAKVYRRPIHSTIARSLIKMWRAAGTDWQHIPTTIGGQSREEGKLRYWGLVEEQRQPRTDGGRSGWWRVTEKGEAWVRGHATVPKYAHIYDGRCLKLDGPEVTIEDALGEKFSYAELMGLEDEAKIEETRQFVSPSPVVSAGPEPGSVGWGHAPASDPAETTALFDPASLNRPAGPYDDLDAA